jgi:hypothetical protein
MTDQPNLIPWASEHYGCRVVEISECGEYAIAGHVPDRRALAATLRYLRVDCGIRHDEVDLVRWLDQPRIHRRWVVPVTADQIGDEDGWLWADDEIRQAVTLVSL